MLTKIYTYSKRKYCGMLTPPYFLSIKLYRHIPPIYISRNTELIYKKLCHYLFMRFSKNHNSLLYLTCVCREFKCLIEIMHYARWGCILLFLHNNSNIALLYNKQKLCATTYGLFEELIKYLPTQLTHCEYEFIYIQ